LPKADYSNASALWTLRVVLPARLFTVATHSRSPLFWIDEIRPNFDLAEVLPLQLGDAS